MKEIWKDIQGYEGLYQVSNLGRVKSLIGWNGHEYVKREKVIDGWNSDKGNGYICKKVRLCKYGKGKEAQVHRLVAEAFLPKVKGKNVVNHKDFNPLNNEVSNLEWCTQNENIEYSKLAGRMSIVSKEKKKAVLYDYVKGVKVEDICKSHSLSVPTVYKILNDLGIEKDRRKKGKYNIDLDELLNDFKNGLSNKEIKEKHSCTDMLIATRRYQFKKRGLLWV